jgi:hypothetical protein
MSTKNPFEGGPDFVKSLINAIEVVPNAYTRPPQAGGQATSVRLPAERIACLDAIATSSSWTRNEVVNALLDKGIFILFHQLKDEQVERIMEQVMQQIFPPTHGVSNMELHNGHRIGAGAKQKRSGRWYSIFQYSMADNPVMIFTSEDFSPDFATENEAIDYGRKQAMEAVERNLASV